MVEYAAWIYGIQCGAYIKIGIARETLDRARKERAALVERQWKRAEQKSKSLQSKENLRTSNPLVRERSSVQS